MLTVINNYSYIPVNVWTHWGELQVFPGSCNKMEVIPNKSVYLTKETIVKQMS